MHDPDMHIGLISIVLVAMRTLVTICLPLTMSVAV
jgi:hypothetical protein